MSGQQIPGVGSGLDIKTMVKAIVDSEMSPKESALKRRESRAETELTVLGQIYAAGGLLLQSCRSMAASNWLLAKSSDPSVVSIKMTGTPAAGEAFRLEVIQLATAGQALSGYQSTGTVFAEGQLCINVKDAEDNYQEYFITAPEGTRLFGLAQRINADTDAGTRVRATVLQGALGDRILLSHRETGAGVTIGVSATNGLEALAQSFAAEGYESDTGEGKNATYKLNGVELTSRSNKLTGVMKGIELQLRQAAEGQNVLVEVNHDVQKATAGLEDFASQCTQFLKLANQVARGDIKQGAQGSSLIRNLAMKIDRLLGQVNQTQPSVRYRALADIGLVRQRDGSLALNPQTLSRALLSQPDEVSALISSKQGPVARIGKLVNAMDQPGSGLQARGRGLEQDAHRLVSERLRLDLERQQITDRLLRKYVEMDQRIGRLRQIGGDIELMQTRIVNRDRSR